MATSIILPTSFYLNDNVVQVGKKLLGKHLFTNIDGVITGGIIIETESYFGAEDKACHAYGNKLTPRTKTMFARGGVCYVYLCYGIHNLLNIVTNKEGIPHAVLIRAIKPTHGIETMLKRRSKKALDDALTAGPGSLTKALGITRSHDGTCLMSPLIWIEDRRMTFTENQIIASPRIGIDYAGEHAKLPLRFQLID